MVDSVQAHLEAIYGIICEMRVRAFLVDAKSAQLLGGTGRSEEELLVSAGEGEVELALFLHPLLLERLKALEEGPWNGLSSCDLDAYCQVAEGVSHFMYVVRAAESGRTVSLLELEAQAEVDKFASCLLRRWGDGGEGIWAQELLERLFKQVRYRNTLTEQERWRYQEANRLSERYCKSLLPHVLGRRMDRLLSALRYMYRLGAEAKLRHFAEAN